MVSGHRLWIGSLFLGVVGTTGCNAIMNGWLDPTVVGNYRETRTNEIRASLTLEDTPPGIPGAAYPTREDRKIIIREYPITPGDTLLIEIHELRDRGIPFQVQAAVTTTGYVNLPVVGRVKASGITVPELEEVLREALTEKELLVEPEVTVNPLFLQATTYSIFGVGVSAANDAPLRAGTFPITRPNLTILEAINQVGGLNEFVTDIYVFRGDGPWSAETSEHGRVGVREPGEPLAPTPVSEDQDQPEGQPDESAAGEPTEDDSAAASERVDLLELIEGEASESEDEPPIEELTAELEPDRAGPYIYVNGEFVQNPAYEDVPSEPLPSSVAPPSFDTATPSVNWSRIAGDTSFRIIRIPAEQLREGDPEVNIYIRAGDTIRIVSGEIGVYYVMGQVGRVGPFAFNAEPITLKAAIAAAGGLSPLAWPDRCTVYRRLGQREQMIQVNLDRIFAGKDPDFYIRRGDIINVGTHPFAPFLQRIRAYTLPNPTTNMGYSFVYSRNFADIDSYGVRQNPHNKPDEFPLLFP